MLAATSETLVDGMAQPSIRKSTTAMVPTPESEADDVEALERGEGEFGFEDCLELQHPHLSYH